MRAAPLPEGLQQCLADRSATPFYFIDVDAIAAEASAMKAAFDGAFADCAIAYSYKTNAAKCITTTLCDVGLHAEVVSGPEIRLAVTDGYTPERMFFDGPLKTLDELQLAVNLGVRIQLDSAAEAEEITTVAKRSDRPARISLRGSVRRRFGWSRFGFMPNEILPIADSLARQGLCVSGFHFNLGTNQLSPKRYVAVLRSWQSEVVALMKHCRNQDRFVIDIGGGFPARSAGPNIDIPPWEDFAGAAREAVDAMGIIDDITLVAEPGRSLVEDHGYVIYGVVAQKRRRNRRLLIVDSSGLLVSSRGSWFHPVHVSPAGPTRYDIYGSGCFEGDAIAKSARGPAHIAVGQRIILGSAGGYDIASARGWNRPLPAVWVHKSGELQQVDPRTVFNEYRILDGAGDIGEERPITGLSDRPWLS